ncbi:hypothetical protein CAPTEDRAFT_223479 [Capitella teleta]|uniref:Uncharacterized protein n=1 Tax=Capitella teleta TaxID=283909 RepID=R7V162_CAPTE|nr:hypothetical protein CAPTEDRAFT_223479 [Capitella teleta]|eukprot:ELU12269.1 hypothetical protein CAPTEDRAFT_223479 [Capitella teleta]
MEILKVFCQLRILIGMVSSKFGRVFLLSRSSLTELCSATTIPPSANFPPGIQYPSETGLRGIRVQDLPLDPRHQFNFTASGILGSIQMAAGVSSMVLMFAAFASKAELYYLAHGIWCGIPFLFAGFFGVVLAIKREYNVRMVMVFVGFSCVSAVFSVILVSISCAAIYQANRFNRHRENHIASDVGERLIIHSLHLIVGLVEGFMSVGSIYICAKFLAGRYHSDVGNPYGVLEDSAQYQTPSTAAPDGRIHETSDGRVIFLTIPSQLCPSHGSSGHA